MNNDADLPHCTAVEQGVASCTCGWRSPQAQTLWFDTSAEDMATWHRLSIGATISNPLLDQFLSPVTEQERADPLMQPLATISEWILHRLRRDRLTAEYAWAIPTEPVIYRLADLSPICDMGCGTGYWASLLTKAGAEVLAVDAQPPLGGDNAWHHSPAGLSRRPVTIRHFAEIVLGEAATYEVPPSHTLMLCWPPYSDAMASTALARYRGDRVIYIGESDGCTGDGAFHTAIADRWHQIAYYDIPQWPGIHDAVYVYERNK